MTILTNNFGNPDGSPIDVSTHERLFDQAEVSFSKWPTSENLCFWMNVVSDAFFDDMIRMHSVLKIIYMDHED